MSQNLKRLRSQVQSKKEIVLIANEKSTNKKPTAKATKQTLPPPTTTPSSLTPYHNFNSAHLNSTNSKQPTNHYHSKQTYSNVKLNRIQSEYIRPINSQSLPKTPKISKLNSNKIVVDSTKLKKPVDKEGFNVCKDYCKDYMQTAPKAKRSTTKRHDHTTTRNPQFTSQTQHEFITKKSLKTSKISSKSLTRQHSSFKQQPTIDMACVKQKAKTKRTEPFSQKSEIKRLSKKGIDTIKLVGQNKKQPSLKKTPSSTGSVQKYYILQKTKVEKGLINKGMALTTYRSPTPSTTHAQPHPIKSLLTSSNHLIKIYNSSTDLTTNSIDRQRQILQRVQRTLQYYRISLDQEIEKRRMLEMENQMLKEGLMKAGRGGGNQKGK